MANDNAVARLHEALNESRIPDYMHTGLVDYITEGNPVGGFLHAILSNDLKRACNAADDNNQKVIYDYVLFLYNFAPAACWGSPERVEQWMKLMKETV